MVKDEISLAVKTQVGETRKVIRGLNQMTQQVDGRVFTDTEVGKDFEDYAQHQVLAAVIKLGKILGVTVPAAEAARIAKTQVSKWISSLTADPATPVHGGTTPTPAHTTTPAPGGSAHPAAHPTPEPTDDPDTNSGSR